MSSRDNERLLEAAMALLQNTPERELNITSLNKALFYLDLTALRDKGKTVTGATYIALPQGPVVARYDKKLIPPLCERGLAVQDDRGSAKPVRVVRPLEQFEYLSNDEVKRAVAVAQDVAKHTSTRLSDFSHENPGWIIAYERGLKHGRPPEKIDMLIALQQVIEDDPWLTEPPDEEFDRAVAAASPSEGEDW